jgi:processing peptidase subunit beta
MASRSLALRLNQGLRTQRAIRAVQAKSQKPGLVRSLATPVSHGSTTESTTLSNGFTVCCH